MQPTIIEETASRMARPPVALAGDLQQTLLGRYGDPESSLSRPAPEITAALRQESSVLGWDSPVPSYSAGPDVDHADSCQQDSRLSLDYQRGPRHLLR
jgi:hypothetical protein